MGSLNKDGSSESEMWDIDWIGLAQDRGGDEKL
jgi:hypothetical protein